MLGGLAVSYGFMMYPSLIAVCYWPFITRQGAVLGLIAGIIAVTVTFTFKLGLPWGAYPLTIHCAGWGIIFNLPIAIIVSALTQGDKAENEHRAAWHSFVREHASLPPEKKGLRPVAWIITLVWFFFAIGPGCVIGNTLFGDPLQPDTWLFGMSSIWLWQIIWWILGIFMMWFLAYKMEMSTNVTTEFSALKHDIYEEAPAEES
jgi:hypothetical protein